MRIKGKILAKTWKILFPALLLLCLTHVTPVHVNAEQYPYINAEMLPSQGGANTTILLRFTTTNSSISSVQSADIFWDNNTITLNQQGTLGANGAYNYNLTVPTESPLSNQGNHTIRVDTNVAPYGTISFSFTFTITEFVPSPEYLDLNETYYSLLTNYTNILGNYTQLLSSYAELSANFTVLMAQHNNDTLNYNTLISQYNLLNTNYNSFTANYNLLSNYYGNLTASYASISSNYADLHASFQTLGSNYSTLSQDFNMLNSSYTGLLSNYNSVIGQLEFSRNLNYSLIITMIALAIATAYFAIIKPKRQKKTR
jgi:hypothetical protein